MTLVIPNAGDTTYASTINQLVNILQQPAGGMEKRTYHLAGNSYTTGVFIQCYVISRSRGTIPVAFSLDTSGETNNNFTNVTGSNLTSAGVQIYGQTSAQGPTCVVGGNVTFQY